jgi:hypothetical protein
MATYSQTATGYVVGGFNLSTTKIYNIPDLSSSGIQTGIAGGQAKAMQTRDQVLVKGPDGALHWYEFDAERSTPANPILRFVGP